MANVRIEAPIMAQWDITTGCNFSCSFCLTNSGKRQDNELTFKEAKLIVDRLYSGGILFLRILGGEPFFRNDIMRIMDYAVNKGMLLSFSTNASLIDDDCARFLSDIQEHLNYFQVSLYGIDHESYEKTTKSRHGFQLVSQGIGNLVKHNLRPYVFWVLTLDNIEYVESAYHLVHDWELPALRISPKLNLGRASRDVNSELSCDTLYWHGAMDVFSKLNSLVEQNGSPVVQLHARPFLGEYLYKKTGLPYFYITCKAAVTMIYVDYKGDASPCPFADFMPSAYCSTFKSREKMSLLDHCLEDVWQSDAFVTYRRLQNPDESPNQVFKGCPHLKSGMCNPCIYTPCTCRNTIKIIKHAINLKENHVRTTSQLAL